MAGYLKRYYYRRTMIPRVLLILFLAVSQIPVSADLKRDAVQAIERGVKFFPSTSIEGGYGWFVTPDLSQRWGEGILDDRTVEVQPPGTPTVGMTLMRAFDVTEYTTAFRLAKATAAAVISGQNDLGGWGHVIAFDLPKPKVVSFDDDQTQTAMSFLMAYEQKFADDAVWAAVEKGLNLMTGSQLNNGGWPHRYPKQNNYHDYATFNDEGINDCIRLMIEADNYYTNSQLRSSLSRVARFLMVSQLPPPQSGWAQQYNEHLQPAWARSFEPPSVCPQVTLNNLNSLMDLAVHLDNRDYLEPIHDSLRWLDEVQLPNGLWARFIEIGTGDALYYDLGRIRVNSPEELSEERRLGYGYQTDLSDKLDQVRKRFASLWNSGKDLDPLEDRDPAERLAELEAEVTAIIAAQDKKGGWITKDDKYKKRIPGQPWNGEWEVQDRISSKVFVDNINTLADYIELAEELQTWKGLRGKRGE
jgi:PelA/Pel-15E family pectate lyase